MIDPDLQERDGRGLLQGASLAFKKVAAAHRSEIAALKRRTHALEQQLRHLGKISTKVAPPAASDESPETRRFSAKGFASLRRRLGLSATDCGLLVGASSQSIYNWEEGKMRPRAKHLPAIAALRGEQGGGGTLGLPARRRLD